MLELFTNPGYLAAAGALVSAPIIIHLINRMRYKRIHWAAMEFLLKAQTTPSALSDSIRDWVEGS